MSFTYPYLIQHSDTFPIGEVVVREVVIVTCRCSRCFQLLNILFIVQVTVVVVVVLEYHQWQSG